MFSLKVLKKYSWKEFNSQKLIQEHKLNDIYSEHAFLRKFNIEHF